MSVAEIFYLMFLTSYVTHMMLPTMLKRFRQNRKRNPVAINREKTFGITSKMLPHIKAGLSERERER